jgi:hypothetical protein
MKRAKTKEQNFITSLAYENGRANEENIAFVP